MKQPWWIIIASGPSLTRADCDALRGIGKTIAVNNAILYAPWVDFLYAGDVNWWLVYGPEITWFKGKRLTYQDYATICINKFRQIGDNSGHQALQYAAKKGAKRIALIGFDHQRTGGKAHFHKDHKRRTELDGKAVMLANAAHMPNWVTTMDITAGDLLNMQIEVVNLSRETALECFPRMSVEKFVDYVSR